MCVHACVCKRVCIVYSCAEQPLLSKTQIMELCRCYSRTEVCCVRACVCVCACMRVCVFVCVCVSVCVLCIRVLNSPCSQGARSWSYADAVVTQRCVVCVRACVCVCVCASVSVFVCCCCPCSQRAKPWSFADAIVAQKCIVCVHVCV